MGLLFLFCALTTSNAFAGSADFDSYMNANAHNPALTNKARNQEAFETKNNYHSNQDPKVTENKGNGSFKLGGSTSSGSFGGAPSSGAGSFKPTAVTTKPVTLAPAAQATNNRSNSQQPAFGTVGRNPTTSSASTGSSGSGTTGFSGASSATTASNCSPGMSAQTCAAMGGGTGTQYTNQGANPYVSSANQMASQQYGASQAAYQGQQTGASAVAARANEAAAQAAAAQAQAAAQQAQQAAIQNVLQQTRTQVQVPIFIPR